MCPRSHWLTSRGRFLSIASSDDIWWHLVCMHISCGTAMNAANVSCFTWLAGDHYCVLAYNAALCMLDGLKALSRYYLRQHSPTYMRAGEWHVQLGCFTNHQLTHHSKVPVGAGAKCRGANLGSNSRTSAQAHVQLSKMCNNF
jgi:hypothetical protein